MVKQNDKHPHSDLIDKLGGTTAAARFFEVSPPSVSDWRKDGIPRSRMMYLRLARPDLFGSKKGRRSTDKNQ